MRLIAAALALVAAIAVPAPHDPSAVASPTAGRATLEELRPEIVVRRIAYGPRRRRQMAAYGERHYGERSWALTDVRVIVEHYTDGLTWQGAWRHFASNATHNGEKPGTCTHFIIDRDGTIYRLVDLGVRCRHVVGLNDRSIGIEHVGTGSAMVLGNERQMDASLELTTWLMARYGVNIGNVIGHGEALESPYHHELNPDWRCLVHADFRHAAMQTYRDRLRDVLRDVDVPLGDGPVWEPSGC